MIGAAIGMLIALMASTLGLWDVLGTECLTMPTAACATVGLALGLTQRLTWVMLVGLALIALSLVAALTPLTNRAMQSWVRQDAPPAGHVGAVVVLSGGLNSDGNLNIVTADRLLTGLELVRAGMAPQLLTTRVVKTLRGERVSSDPDQRRLIQLAGEDSAWTILDSVSDTRHEAERAASFLLPRGIRIIAVVTSPAHTRRACATFEMLGFQVYCVPARERGHSTWRPKDAGDRLASFRSYLYERLGMRKYQIKGWVRRETAP